MKVLHLLILSSISINICIVYSISEWSQIASEEKQQALESIGLIFHQVYAEHIAEFEAATANDANFKAFVQTFKNPDLCEVARQAEELFFQLSGESKVLILNVFKEMEAVIEDVFSSKILHDEF
jgi:hypothetical protein